KQQRNDNPHREQEDQADVMVILIERDQYPLTEQLGGQRNVEQEYKERIMRQYQQRFCGTPLIPLEEIQHINQRQYLIEETGNLEVILSTGQKTIIQRDRLQRSHNPQRQHQSNSQRPLPVQPVEQPAR